MSPSSIARVMMITVVSMFSSPSSVLFALATHILDDRDPTLEGFVPRNMRCYNGPGDCIYLPTACTRDYVVLVVSDGHPASSQPSQQQHLVNAVWLVDVLAHLGLPMKTPP